MLLCGLGLLIAAFFLIFQQFFCSFLGDCCFLELSVVFEFYFLHLGGEIGDLSVFLHESDLVLDRGSVTNSTVYSYSQSALMPSNKIWAFNTYPKGNIFIKRKRDKGGREVGTG